ncbi:MAG: O-antigen ligase family protein [Patescibacteria group bacterium]
MKVLKNYLLFTSYLIAVAPFLYLIDLESSYVFTQTTWMRIIALSQLYPLIVLWIYAKETRPRLNLMTSILVAHLLVLCTVNFFSLDIRNSFFGEWRRFGGFFDWFAVYVFFFSLVAVMRGRELWDRYSRYLVGISLLVSLFGLAQASNMFGLYFFDTRVFSTLGNPAFLASYLMLASGFALYSFLAARGATRMYYAAVILMHMIVIYLTETTTVILAYTMVITIAAAYFGIRRMTPNRVSGSLIRSIDFRRDITVIAIAAFVYLAAVGFVAVQSTAYLADARRLDVASDRLIVWKIAISGFVARPLTGWGTNNFYIPFQRYYDPTLYRGVGQTTFFDKAHNEFINHLAEEGILGFLTHTLVIMLPLLFMISRRDMPTKDRCITFFSIGYFIYLLLFFHSIADTLYFFISLALLYSHDDVKITERTTSLPNSLGYVVIGVAVVISVSIHVRDVTSSYLAKAATRSSGVVALERNVAAWSLSPRGHRTILNNLGAAENIQGVTAADTSVHYRQFIQLTREYINESPLDAQYVLLYARILRGISDGSPSDIEYALTINSIAIELSPTNSFAYLTRGLTRIELAGYVASQTEATRLRELGLLDLQTSLRLSPNAATEKTINAIVRYELTHDSDQLLDFISVESSRLSGGDWRVLIQYLASVGAIDMLGVLRDLFNTQLASYQYSHLLIDIIDLKIHSLNSL